MSSAITVMHSRYKKSAPSHYLNTAVASKGDSSAEANKDLGDMGYNSKQQPRQQSADVICCENQTEIRENSESHGDHLNFSSAPKPVETGQNYVGSSEKRSKSISRCRNGFRDSDNLRCLGRYLPNKSVSIGLDSDRGEMATLEEHNKCGIMDDQSSSHIADSTSNSNNNNLFGSKNCINANRTTSSASSSFSGGDGLTLKHTLCYYSCPEKFEDATATLGNGPEESGDDTVVAGVYPLKKTDSCDASGKILCSDINNSDGSVATTNTIEDCLLQSNKEGNACEHGKNLTEQFQGSNYSNVTDSYCGELSEPSEKLTPVTPVGVDTVCQEHPETSEILVPRSKGSGYYPKVIVTNVSDAMSQTRRVGLCRDELLETQTQDLKTCEVHNGSALSCSYGHSRSTLHSNTEDVSKRDPEIRLLEVEGQSTKTKSTGNTHQEQLNYNVPPQHKKKSVLLITTPKPRQLKKQVLRMTLAISVIHIITAILMFCAQTAISIQIPGLSVGQMGLTVGIPALIVGLLGVACYVKRFEQLGIAISLLVFSIICAMLAICSVVMIVLDMVVPNVAPEISEQYNRTVNGMLIALGSAEVTVAITTSLLACAAVCDCCTVCRHPLRSSGSAEEHNIL